jgi:Asp/Glu/hydantoin racemase
MKTVCAVHTAMPMVEATKIAFGQHVPGVRLINMVDDSLIQDVIRAGKVTPSVARRLQTYYGAAVEAGADVILNTCSSVGEVASQARSRISVPIVRIDDAMARRAVETGRTVGVLATLPTTLGPTVRLVLEWASKLGLERSAVEGLAEGAFEALLEGDVDAHDSLVREEALRIAPEVDLMVLAQGSMARMEADLAGMTDKPVLSSPVLGVKQVRAVLEGKEAC